MTIGAMITLEANMEPELEKLRSVGLRHCQIRGWDMALHTPQMAARLRELLREARVTLTTYWCGWPGPIVWDFIEGPLTLGLVPPEYRFARCQALKEGSDFAKILGATQFATHAGFLPEHRGDPLYPGTLAALRDVALHCKKNGQAFLFETGQETPTTLRRVIDDLALDNVGVNLDPANLLMYGKGSAVDAVEILGPFVKDVHAKDGEYPQNGNELGEEKPLGQGRVQMHKLLARLLAMGYDGPITIEREIEGEEQQRDIRAAVQLLRQWTGA